MKRNNYESLEQELEFNNKQNINELLQAVGDLKTASKSLQIDINEDINQISKLDSTFDQTKQLFDKTLQKVDGLLNHKSGRIVIFLALICVFAILAIFLYK